MTKIAIVGMSCRFADSPNVHAFWDLIRRGGDAFGPVPADRWSTEMFHTTSARDMDRTTAPAGAFIQDIRSFPALALGIPPRRVEVMDPQQRFALWTAIEAIEDAGYKPSELPRRTGVFIGVTANEYRVLQSTRISAMMMASGSLGEIPTDLEALSHAVENVVPPRPFTAAGVLSNMCAATVAQELNLTGPAYTVDAACSSAMIALSDAVSQLRTGQIDAALAGGAYLQITPEHYVAFSRIGAMSDNGRCRPFDTAADGFVQGDGVGLVLLKRLEDAVRDGDRIVAVLEGMALNNDGRGEGPMAPSLDGQVDVIASAWKDAGQDPATVSLIEAHGTGTAVGDVTELNGLRASFGGAAQVFLGSSKANVGHTMSAAGIAGVIKTALSIHHGVIPPLAGFETAKPDLNLADGPFRIPTTSAPWSDSVRRAGVSSFGFGGTNGHVVLSRGAVLDAPKASKGKAKAAPKATPETAVDTWQLVTLSGPDEAALKDLCARTADAIALDPSVTPAGVSRAWAVRRAQPFRAALVVRTRDELISALRAIATGAEQPAGTRSGLAGDKPKIAFLYPGQGAQRVGMLRDLQRRFPIVAETLLQQQQVLQDILQAPLTQILYPETGEQKLTSEAASARITATENCQPAMFAVGWALTRLLTAAGVTPTVVTGHSLGEFVAASAAGVWSPEDAVRFVARRGRLMADLQGDHGAMAAVMADRATVEGLLGDGAVIANENHPRQLVVSGTQAAIAGVVARATAASVQAKPIEVSHAFHSPLLAGINSASLLTDTALSAPTLPVASGISDRLYASADHARDVFSSHATSPVIFTRALAQCADAGADVYLQVGAGGPLASFARGTLKDGVRAILTLASLEDNDGGYSLLDNLGLLWVLGADLDTRALASPGAVASVPPAILPTESYWAVKDKPVRALSFKGVEPRARKVVEVEAKHAPAAVAAPAAEAPSEDDPLDRVLRVVSKVSAYPKATLKSGSRLVEDLGFDSIMMNDLATGLADAFPGLGGIPQDLLVNSPTIQTLVDFVRGGARVADDHAEDLPLADLKPVWRTHALPALPTRPLRLGTWLITGPERDATARAAADLATAGLSAQIATLAEAAVTGAHLAGLIWVGPPVASRVSAVLGGKTDLPDPVSGLIAVLANQARQGAKPDVVAISAADDVWSAAVGGALRSLSREWTDATIKHLITDDRRQAPARVVAELTSADRTIDVRYLRGQRAVPGFDTLDAAPVAPLGKDDVVVITGGTHGIGLRLGLRLASDVAKVVLVGRNPPADADAAAISAFPNLVVARADVLNLDALRAALAPHRATALIHAAGTLADGAVQDVDPERGRAAFHVKVTGWLNALRAIGPTLRRATAISSWAGRFGNRHQVWYGAANALLSELTLQPPTGVAASAAEFGPWTGSDMAASIPASVRAAMKADGVDFVGWEPGLDALSRDLRQAVGPIVHGRRVPTELGRRSVNLTLSTQTDPFLLDHAIDDTPILPLAGATDLLAWAADVAAPFEVKDVTLYQGVTVREPVPLTVSFENGKAQIRQGKGGALSYTATVGAYTGKDDFGAPLTGGDPSPISLEEFYGGVTFHGPLLQGIVRIDGVGADFVRGAIRAGSPKAWTPASSRAAFSVDPLAVDSAMQLAAAVAWVRYQRAGTPVKIGRVVVLQPLVPGRIYTAEATFGAMVDDRFEATLTLRDDAGAPMLVAQNVVAELRKVAGAAASKAETTDISQFPEVLALQHRLDELAAKGLKNPYFHVHEGTARNTTVVGGRRLVNFSSYNYIGLSGDPDVLAAVHAAVERYGTSVSASRVASGERPFHGELEALLARCQGAEDAVLFTAGHATNVTTIGHMFGPEDLVLHDEYIHDSALQGIKLSGAVRRSFRHDDPAHLEVQLRELRPHYRRCLIVVEGVYSMDGDIADLPSYIRLKKEHGALLMVDEAHSFGIVGATGRGVSEHFGFDGREVDIWMGTLSKSLASCGGWIAGSKALIQFLRYTAPGFVYSAGLTAANGVAALASLKKMIAEPWRVRRLQDNAKMFHEALEERGMDTGPALGGSGVIPVITGNSAHAMILSQALREQGVNVQPIVYPAVAENAARLRFFLSSTHTPEELVGTAERVAATLDAIREQYPATAEH